MKVKLKDVHPNPFRNMERYPIHKQKILQLKNSIQSTDFWDNIVARKREGGGIEIAYGHHRLTALNKLYSGTKEFNWIVRDLDDDEMLKIMAHENLDEWGHDSAIERETIRAVVEAYGRGQIALPKPAKNTGQTHCVTHQVFVRKNIWLHEPLPSRQESEPIPTPPTPSTTSLAARCPRAPFSTRFKRCALWSVVI